MTTDFVGHLPLTADEALMCDGLHLVTYHTDELVKLVYDGDNVLVLCEKHYDERYGSDD